MCREGGPWSVFQPVGGGYATLDFPEFVEDAVDEQRRLFSAEFPCEFHRFVDHNLRRRVLSMEFKPSQSEDIPIEYGLTVGGPFGRERSNRFISLTLAGPDSLRELEALLLRGMCSPVLSKRFNDKFGLIISVAVELVERLQCRSSDIA